MQRQDHRATNCHDVEVTDAGIPSGSSTSLEGEGGARVKRVSCLLLAALALFAVLVVGYYVVEVIQARRATPAIVAAALRSEKIVLQLDDLSPWQTDVLLAVEDPTFYQHPGWDLRTPGAGMTTITQGLVKIHYFEYFRQGLPKIRQTLIARFALDPLVSKEDQLLLFVNEVHMGQVDGQDVDGLDAASQAYFGKPVSELSEDEYIGLVAMIAAPGRFHLREHPAANAERVRRIQRLIAGACAPSGWMDWELAGCQ